MNYNKICECCSHKLTAYTYVLSKRNLGSFMMFADAYVKNGFNPTHPIHDAKLPHEGYAQFNHLRHFGLITNAGNGGRGTWDLSFIGYRFYVGKISIYDRVAVMGNRKLGNDHECRSTTEIKPKKIYIYESPEVNCKTKEEYQKEKGFNFETYKKDYMR